MKRDTNCRTIAFVETCGELCLSTSLPLQNIVASLAVPGLPDPPQPDLPPVPTAKSLLYSGTAGQKNIQSP
jgi:hypothetical protein